MSNLSFKKSKCMKCKVNEAITTFVEQNEEYRFCENCYVEVFQKLSKWVEEMFKIQEIDKYFRKIARGDKND